MGRKVKLTSLPCPLCTVMFKPERKEQKFCSRLCGFKARSKRAAERHVLELTKRCYVCGEVKIKQYFSRNKATLDGYRHECKLCAEKKRKERMLRVRMDSGRKSLYLATLKRGYLQRASLAYSKRSNATQDEWLHHMMHGRVGNPLRKYSSRAEARDAENYRAWLKYWENPEVRERKLYAARMGHRKSPWVMLARKHRRDARIQGVYEDGSVSADLLKELWTNTQTCLYCGRDLNSFNKSVEHMHPMSKGGSHIIDNVVIVCSACNERKRQKWFDEWVEEINEPYRSDAHDKFLKQWVLG